MIPLILAFGMVTTNPENEIPPFAQDLASLIKMVAIESDLLDTREYLTNGECPLSFDEEVKTLRYRYQELKDAPRVVDSLRIGPHNRDEIYQMLQFNRAYYKTLMKRFEQESDRRDFIKLVMDECDDCHKTWDLLRDAKNPGFYTYYRRQALKELRDRLGKEDYELGILPDYAPFWRFNEK